MPQSLPVQSPDFAKPSRSSMLDRSAYSITVFSGDTPIALSAKAGDEIEIFTLAFSVQSSVHRLLHYRYEVKPTTIIGVKVLLNQKKHKDPVQAFALHEAALKAGKKQCQSRKRDTDKSVEELCTLSLANGGFMSLSMGRKIFFVMFPPPPPPRPAGIAHRHARVAQPARNKVS